MPAPTAPVVPTQAMQNGLFIRILRELDEQPVQWLADALDVSAAHVRNIENGHRNASPAHLSLIARVFRVPVVALVRDPADTPQNGFTIRALRERRGRSVQWLANKIQVTAPHMRNFENEHRKVNPSYAAAISGALEVPVDVILRMPLVGEKAAS